MEKDIVKQKKGNKKKQGKTTTKQLLIIKSPIREIGIKTILRPMYGCQDSFGPGTRSGSGHRSLIMDH